MYGVVVLVEGRGEERKGKGEGVEGGVLWYTDLSEGTISSVPRPR